MNQDNKRNEGFIKKFSKNHLYGLDSRDIQINITKAEYVPIKNSTANRMVCPHGILKTHACDMCDSARRGESFI